MPLVGFEPMIPAFDRAKTVRGLDRAITVIGLCANTHWNYMIHTGNYEGHNQHSCVYILLFEVHILQT
jgi:hypothetical protein